MSERVEYTGVGPGGSYEGPCVACVARPAEALGWPRSYSRCRACYEAGRRQGDRVVDPRCLGCDAPLSEHEGEGGRLGHPWNACKRYEARA